MLYSISLNIALLSRFIHLCTLDEKWLNKCTCSLYERSLALLIRGSREPRDPLNSLAAPSISCREPNDVLVSIHTTFNFEP